ncbi:unnamed protein product [Clavelina lepadiformis]|uniref:Uncharacterized protein n=1 Tax=Clavelina lepadiformis TaxID=159417 RepID=A0ABP0GJ13_CLALP
MERLRYVNSDMSTQFSQRLSDNYLSSEKSGKQLPPTLQPEWDPLFDYLLSRGPLSQDAKDQFLTPEKIKFPFMVSDRRRNALFNRAVSLRLEGSYDAALKLFQEELEIRKELSSDESRDEDIADTFNQIGICFDRLNNSKKALEYFKESLKIRRTITEDKGKDKDIAAILFNMGISHKNLDNHQEGLKHFQGGLAIEQNLALNKKNKPLIAKYFSQIGLCHFYLNQFDKALNNFSSALEFMDSSSSDEDTQTFVSSCLFNEGICLTKLDKMDDAFTVWEKSSHILLKSVSDKNALTRRYQEIGSMLMDNNNYKEAAKYLTSRLDVLKEINAEEKLNKDIAGTLLLLGVCYGNMHLPEKALECLQEGLSIQQQLPQDDQHHSITSKYHTNNGICHAQLKRHEQALQHFRSALEFQHKALANDDTMRITARLHCLMAVSFLGTGRLAEALLEFKTGFEIELKISLKEIKDKSDADLLFQFGLCLIGLGRQNEAIEKFQEALNVQKRFSVNPEVDEDIAAYSYVVGVCLAQNNAPQEALTFFENGLAIREKTSPEKKRNKHVALFLNQIGKCLFDLDKLDEALSKHLSAIEIQKEASTDLARDENAAAYFFNAGVCLQKLNRHDEALEYFNSALEIQKKISKDTDSDDVHVLATLSHIIDSLFARQRFSEIKILLKKHPVFMTLKQPLEITVLKRIASAAYVCGKQSMATGKEREALSHFKTFVTFRNLSTVQHLTEVPVKSEQQQQTTSQMALSVCSTYLEGEVENQHRQSTKDSCHKTKNAGTGGETFSSKETSSTYVTLCTSAIVGEGGDVIKFGSCEIHIPPGALEEYIFFKFALKHKPSIEETSENIVLTPTLQCSPSQTFKRPASIKMPTCYRTTQKDVLVTPETNDGCGWKKLDPVEVQDDNSISFSTTSFCEKRIQGPKANFNVKKMMFIYEKSSEESSDPVIKWKMVENLPDVHDIENAWTFSVEVRKKQNLILEMICPGAESEPAQTKIRTIQIFKDKPLISGQFAFIKDEGQIDLENVECKLKDADTEESVASKSFQFHSSSEKGKSVTTM